MKILWMSDSPASPSGYGNIARQVCAGLAAAGHEVSILGWQSRRRSLWAGCTVFPVGKDPFGADVLPDVLRETRPDALVTASDAWRVFYVANPALGRLRRELRVPWVLYHAIDGDLGDQRLPPSLVQAIRSAELPLAMSRYGRDLTANGGTAAYVPVGVDLAAFRPPRNKATAKSRLGYEGKFVVLSDARNQPRKLLPRALEVFRGFAQGRDDVLLHLHCDPDDPAARTEEYCYRVKADVAFLGLEDRVRFTPGMAAGRGISAARLHALYQAADVHLLASYGEGFGLPTLQAAAAGLVPMAADYSASAELTRGHGEPLPVRHFTRGPLGLRMALLDVDQAGARLERLYEDRRLLAEKSAASRRFAEGYRWSEVVRQWDELLTNAIPALRAAMHERLNASGTPVLAGNVPAVAGGGEDSSSREIDPETESLALQLESLGGRLAAQFLRDGARCRGNATLPVTLPPAPGPHAAGRVTGRAFLAGDADLPAFHALQRIFPGMTRVPTEGPRRRCGVSSPGTDGSRGRVERLLATSTLALDGEGSDPGLPAAAARVGTPCITLRTSGRQAELWPELALEAPDDARAAELGRWVLTDQGAAAELCSLARSRLKGERKLPHSDRYGP